MTVLLYTFKADYVGKRRDEVSKNVSSSMEACKFWEGSILKILRKKIERKNLLFQ